MRNSQKEGEKELKAREPNKHDEKERNLRKNTDVGCIDNFAFSLL